MVTVSVCIVTYNSAEYIDSCLEAVMLQTYPIHSIVVVDNASSDETVALIKSKIENGASIVIIENEQNFGFAGGQNQAIEATNTDYVLVLNPDVTLEPDYISLLVNHLEKDKRCGSATGLLVLQLNPSLVDSTGLVMGASRHAIDRGAGEKVEQWLQRGEIFGVSGAAALYARRMIQDIKLENEFFDELFFAYKEDVDVAWRAKLLGWTSYYEPSAKAMHARGWQKGGRRSISRFVRQHSYQNQLLMIIKNEQMGWHLLYTIPLFIVRETAKLLYIVLKERDLIASWKSIIKLLPQILLKRKLLREKIEKKASLK